MTRAPKDPFAPPRRPENPFAPREARPRNRANETALCQAMQQKRLVSFRYRPADTLARIIAPHVVWITVAESARLFGMQLQSETGASESSPQQFDPYKMTSLTVLTETFQPDPTFKRDAYDNVICMVPR